ncbi:nucleolar protein 56/58-like [Vairimorpha necatrix]|uniref:Nucleolar protein 56 n=1 Tax=Vairimorpha necatrix TaxID=6039 RepID=A0AAX4JAN0_9MICR
MKQHVLYEHPKGYLLFEMNEYEDLSQGSYQEYMKLTQVVNLTAKFEFADVQMATQNIQMLCNNKLPKELENFLELNNVKILHCDSSFKQALKEIKIKQKNSINIYRGIKFNEHRFLKSEIDLQFILGVAHTFSRNKVEYNSKKEDNILIHTVNMLEQLEKDINSYSMRIKELYGWSFPELYCACDSIDEYIAAVIFFTTENKNENIKNEKIDELIKLKDNSIGIKINEVDMINIKNLCDIINEKINIKNSLKKYLKEKMLTISPNLTELLGDMMSAKLIVLCGGLCNLAKATASTIQLLGAEKSLFQALKSKSDTPKYGIIFYSKLVSKTQMKNKAKFCRFLASKISILAKIDCFSVNRTNAYGVAIKKVVKKKIKSFDNDKQIEKTDEIMSRVYKKLKTCEK